MDFRKRQYGHFYSGTLQSVLYPIHARHISEDAQEFMKMNGCCIPGSRKLYVTAVGEFKVCERIGKSPAIGNVYCGIDFSKLFKVYIDEFQEKEKVIALIVGRLHCAMFVMRDITMKMGLI